MIIAIVEKISLSVVLAIFILIFALFNGFLVNKASVFIPSSNHFSKLAQSFIHNELYLNPLGLPESDYADFRGKQFVFYGPMPAVMLIPFVLVFGQEFPETFLSFISLIVIFVLIYLISKKFVPRKVDALILAEFFVFGTVLYFLGLIFITAYVAQVVATTFVIAAITVYLYRKNWLIIGILVAFAGLSRVTLFGAAVFFILEIIRMEKKQTVKSLIYLILPILIAVSLFGVYNHRRFGSYFQTGYQYNITIKNYPLNVNAAKGFFSLRHVPANLFVLLLRGPAAVRVDGSGYVLKFPYLKADGWGLAIWFTSPLFLYLAKLRKSPYTFSAVATIIILAVPILLYFGIGYSQFGYRYSLDFLPFLFLLLLPTFKNGLPILAKSLIAGGIIFDCVYMLSLWDVYPFFHLGQYLKF